MNHVSKAAQTYGFTDYLGLVGIGVVVADNLTQIGQGMDDGAFAGAVGPVKHGDRPDGNGYALLDSLEVRNGDLG